MGSFSIHNNTPLDGDGLSHSHRVTNQLTRMKFHESCMSKGPATSAKQPLTYMFRLHSTRMLEGRNSAKFDTIFGPKCSSRVDESAILPKFVNSWVTPRNR